jgi:hypothetical protein
MRQRDFAENLCVNLASPFSALKNNITMSTATKTQYDPIKYKDPIGTLCGSDSRLLHANSHLKFNRREQEAKRFRRESLRKLSFSFSLR